jgi:protein involved in polysaccharide export with SLBB domain
MSMNTMTFPARASAAGACLLGCLAAVWLAAVALPAADGPSVPATRTNAPSASVPATNRPAASPSIVGGSPKDTGATAITNLLTVVVDGLSPEKLAAMMESLDDRQRLGVGDVVLFRVVEDEDEAKTLTVTDTGDLDVPYYGLVAAVNKTCKQLAQEVKGLLEKELYYRATVIVAATQFNKKRTVGKVYVVGQVRQTGPLDIPDNEVFTVSKAIFKAGGFSEFADRKRVRLVRGGALLGANKKAIIVNVADIWDKGKVENDFQLEPDDLVYVPTRAVNF